MGYFENFYNGLLNKYKKKMGKRLWMYSSRSFKFHAISLSFDDPSKTINFLCNLQWFQFNDL
jgi:hypothetical protein